MQTSGFQFISGPGMARLFFLVSKKKVMLFSRGSKGKEIKTNSKSCQYTFGSLCLKYLLPSWATWGNHELQKWTKQSRNIAEGVRGGCIEEVMSRQKSWRMGRSFQEDKRRKAQRSLPCLCALCFSQRNQQYAWTCLFPCLLPNYQDSRAKGKSSIQCQYYLAQCIAFLALYKELGKN